MSWPCRGEPTLCQSLGSTSRENPATLFLPWPQSTLTGQYSGRALPCLRACSRCGMSQRSEHGPRGSPSLRMAFSHQPDRKQHLINNPQAHLLLQHPSPAGEGKQAVLMLCSRKLAQLQVWATKGQPGTHTSAWMSRWCHGWPTSQPHTLLRCNQLVYHP